MKPRTFLVGVLLPAVAHSSTILPHTLAQRFAASDRVAVVQVVSRVTEPEGGDERRLKTHTRLLIGEELKGSGPAEVTLVQLGGRYGAVEARVPGDADFQVGETALVFLRCKTPDRCFLVALGEGKVAIDGGDAVVHDLFTGTWTKKPLKALMAELSSMKPEAAR
jgi:hypothetical protein